MPELDDLDTRLRRLEGWRIDHAGELRDLERVARQRWRECERIAKLVQTMEEQDRVSMALAEAAKATRQAGREHGRVHLSWAQAAIGTAGVACAIASLILAALK